ncbi:MAG: hypothetical protein IJW62_09480 [Clostridia bacterium]|nr:hypothetical protein [Clostridia bacterium]
MSEREKMDVDELLDEMEDRLREMIEDAVSEALDDQLESVVTCAVQDAIEDALGHFEYVLPDGTQVKRGQLTYVLSPDKSKMLCCRGGLRVDGTCLMVQAGTTCWRDIAVYSSREEAVQALDKVKNAMLAHMEIIEL